MTSYYSARWTKRGQHSRGLGLTHVCQRMGDKFHRDAGICHINKMFQGPVSGTCLISHPKKKINYCASHHDEGSICLVGLSEFWTQYISLGILFWTICQVIQKATNFNWNTEQKKVIKQVQAVVQVVLLLGHIWYLYFHLF